MLMSISRILCDRQGPHLSSPHVCKPGRSIAPNLHKFRSLDNFISEVGIANLRDYCERSHSMFYTFNMNDDRHPELHSVCLSPSNSLDRFHVHMTKIHKEVINTLQRHQTGVFN